MTMTDGQALKVLKWVEDEERAKPPIRARVVKKSDQKLVALFDVLGISDSVNDARNEDEEEKIFKTLLQIQAYVRNECDGFDAGKLDYLQIGDGFVIVAALRQINQVCRILSSIQWQALIECKMLVRGALTAGRVQGSRANGFFVGPAVIEAVRFERDNAVYPRIIFVNEIEKLVPHNSIKFNYIVEDEDKIRYLDYINYSFDIGGHSPASLDQLLTNYGIKETLKRWYETTIVSSKSENKKIAQKYGWLITKFGHHGVNII